MAKYSLVKKFDLSSLERIGFGAAPLGKELMKECAKNVPSAMVIQIVQFEHLHNDFEVCQAFGEIKIASDFAVSLEH
ncbi:hypothetical protein WN944_018859 [Citrus x changshan-huyou]|uniref:Uncharacterized protein n=1 Tax=Citrus x changshan-huyou TaxID=2935761 RepID=A0AAP0LYU9_9ROSI